MSVPPQVWAFPCRPVSLTHSLLRRGVTGAMRRDLQDMQGLPGLTESITAFFSESITAVSSESNTAGGSESNTPFNTAEGSEPIAALRWGGSLRARQQALLPTDSDSVGRDDRRGWAGLVGGLRQGSAGRSRA